MEVKVMEKYKEIERSIIKTYRKEIWSKFVKAVSDYELIKENDNIKVTYDFDDDNLQLVNQIDICDTGNANIIIEYKSSTNKECFHNGVIKVFAKENAKLNITVINLLNNNSEHFEAMENILEDNSDLNYTIIDIGGKNSIQNYYLAN